MRRAAATWTLLAGVSILVGCSTTRSFSWIDEGPKPLTRSELYERYGPPDMIRRQDGFDFLRYDYRVDRRMQGGIGASASLIFGRTHSGLDVAWVKVDSEDRIVDITGKRYSEHVGFRLWPFGD